jgi:glycosyltransferase involved in cell wall biosynthesis
MKPAVLMMYKDEADILRESLTAWHSLGISDFYLCDNASSDESAGIVQEFAMIEGINVRQYKNSSVTWVGREMYNAMKLDALSDGCDWIFPADADEFLRLDDSYENIQDWLSFLEKYPVWYEIAYLNINMVSGMAQWNEPQKKCFGRLEKHWNISVGNHIIENAPTSLIEGGHGAYYAHYHLRSWPQFKRKMENWMNAFHNSNFKYHPHATRYADWKERGDEMIREIYVEQCML